MGQAFQFLNLAIGDAAGGGSKAQVFADLGVSFRNSAGGIKTAEEAILDVGEAIKNTGDAAKRTELARELFGRGAGPMITTFMAGKEAIEGYMETSRKVGAVTTQDQAKIAAAFKHTAAMIGWCWEGVQKALAIPIMKGIMPDLERLLNWMKTNPDDMKMKMENLANAIANAFKLVRAVAEVLLNHLNAVIIAITTLAGAGAGLWAGFRYSGLTGAGYGALIGGAAGLAGGLYLTRDRGAAAGSGGVNIQTLNIQAPPLDQATTTRIAGSLQAPLRDALRQQQTEYEGQFKAAAMAGGI